MKHRALLVTLISLFLFSSQVEEPVGVRFFTGSWPDVQAESKRLNRPIFVDFYTSWCPPCKRMAREAFPNANVGAKFNENFINYQLDAEVGEGVQLAKQFAVASYPTALYFIPSGDVVHRAVGYGGVNAMIKQADLVLSMSKVRQARRRRVPQPNSVVPTYQKNPSDSTKADTFLH
ncbi:thioredoxin fold domain-containing protein [Spirosoma sp. BT702]|uniref:Thioredoxin fold domain-containing protein n=1 Tax=Spirosoma profusum TaxID=2771354 RepID=A0A926XVB8_9BACT|nr:thioredoxin fold domain-containing protein [Spirosoma profusum]MBD2700525.1 thioredoxin fold domain-containing protein [Spirosoma profusum]